MAEQPVLVEARESGPKLMPEIGLGLEPGTRAGRAEARRVGGGWDKARGLSDAKDRTFHEALPAPVAEIIARGEPPPPPSETELRSELAGRLAEEREAQEAHDRTHGAYQCAQAHLQTRKQELTSFDDLDAESLEHMVEALRRGDDAELPTGLQDKVVARERARMSFAAADAALLRFADELHAARNELTARTQAVNKAVVPLLGVTAAVGFVRDIREYEEQIRRKQSLLLGYDRLAAAADSAMPESVRDYHFDNLRGRIGTAEQFSVWQTAANTLRADPQAQVEIADPPHPPPPPERAPASYRLPHVKAVMAEQAKARETQAQSETPPTPPQAAKPEAA
jgi:hypothetical protein